MPRTRYPRTLTPDARIALRTYLRLRYVEDLPKAAAIDGAAAAAGRSARYVQDMLLPSPAWRAEERAALREVFREAYGGGSAPAATAAPQAPAPRTSEAAQAVIAGELERAVRVIAPAFVTAFRGWLLPDKGVLEDVLPAGTDGRVRVRTASGALEEWSLWRVLSDLG